MGIAERRARARADLRTRILDAARTLFVTEGYEAVTMRRIAQAIEYSATAVYLHFPDKRAIFEALCTETFDELVARLERLGRRRRDPLRALREGLLTYVTFGLEHPHHYTVTFIIGMQAGEAHAYAGSPGARAFGILQDAVRQARATGRLKPVDVDLTAQALWAGVHGVVSLLIRHPHFPFVSPRKLAVHTVDAMLEGLRA